MVSALSFDLDYDLEVFDMGVSKVDSDLFIG